MNNLDRVKEIADLFLSKPIHYVDYGVAQHPFTNCQFFVGKDMQIVDMKGSKENEQLFRDTISDNIAKANNIWTIIAYVNNAYLMQFLDYIQYFCGDDYEGILRHAWKCTEFPNYIKNSSYDIDDLVNMFEKADRNIMTTDEIETLKNMDDIVTIYRGYNRGGIYDALSWTTDKEIAIWFAKRFGSTKPLVVKAQVLKEDILCYFDSENEVIVNPNKLIEIKPIDFE